MPYCDLEYFTPEKLADWTADARMRTMDFLRVLGDNVLGPRLDIVNPALWEAGHVAWFQERWVLRHCGGLETSMAGSDTIYDSMTVEHGTRWDLDLPSIPDTLDYMRITSERVLERIARGNLEPEEIFLIALSIFHEDMHDEAFTYTRQTLGMPFPDVPTWGLDASAAETCAAQAAALADEAGDVDVPGGDFQLGSTPQQPFVFDNEKWAHPVRVEPFTISRRAVTQAEYARFVEDGGYERRDFWCDEGWAWREAASARHPVYWTRDGDGWSRIHFGSPRALEPNLPVIHVNWFEASAYCRHAGRRLPTEAEWDYAASAAPGMDGNDPDAKRRYPWGAEFPTREHANTCCHATGPIDVGALPAGDSAYGCRQMLGNVWEWTASTFEAFPGFVPDQYEAYSQPWFGTHRVLKGGSWTTRSRVIWNNWRNFYPPHRRDVLAGFRTCALT